MSTTHPMLPVLLNGHRFGMVSGQRAHHLLKEGGLPLKRVDHGLSLMLEDVTIGLDVIHRDLAHRGVIVGWRHELIDALDWSGTLALGVMERAAARFWGSHTRAVHLNGWVCHDDGHSMRLWLARRSDHKATDPGLWDNLVAGLLGPQESAMHGLAREAVEEAGLDLQAAVSLSMGPALLIDREVPQGWQRETLKVIDARLPLDFQPVNQDGEVCEFRLVDAASARRMALSGDMSPDAAKVTLDFLKRHRV